MKVVGLYIENFLNVKVIHIVPTSSIIRIEGKNGTGKSNVIDSIWFGLGGAQASPVRPLRKGAQSGKVVIDLGELTVERKITTSGTYLEVRAASGAKIQRPQEVLNKLFSLVSYDPETFINADDRERREVLLQATGKSAVVADIDGQRKGLYDKRTLVNRDVAAAHGYLASLGNITRVEPVDVSDLTNAYNHATETLSNIAAVESRLSASTSNLTTMKARRDILTTELRLLQDDIDHEAAANDQLRNTLAATVKPDLSALADRIRDAESTNAAARHWKDAEAARAKLSALEAESSNLTAAISILDEQKQAILQEVATSVGAISITDAGGIEVGGTPFADLCTSEQLRVAMEVGASLNPKLRVLRIANGNVFDAEGMAALESFAESRDMQVWIERVADEASGMGVYIRDGEVEGDSQ